MKPYYNKNIDKSKWIRCNSLDYFIEGPYSYPPKKKGGSLHSALLKVSKAGVTTLNHNFYKKKDFVGFSKSNPSLKGPLTSFFIKKLPLLCQAFLFKQNFLLRYRVKLGSKYFFTEKINSKKKIYTSFYRIKIQKIITSIASFKTNSDSYNKNPQTSENSYWNQTFDKGRLKNFVLWFFLKYGEHKTVKLVEELKTIGFNYATKAGISLGVEDLKIPSKKTSLIYESETISIGTIQQFKRGEITEVERFQRLIDTWHRTSEQIKTEVIENFETTDVLNPVYMMAFSGARGNISQVRQLVGMRGLMSNPQGQIIDFPIRSNFREGLTLTEYIISSYGARKGIVDTALRTANAGYLTRRLVDVAQHVIISSTDCGTNRGIFLTDMKDGNKIIYSLQNRLIGRVLARDIYNKQKSKIATKNTEISDELANLIAHNQKKVFVRSALTCQTNKLVCQLCYGWSLAQGHLVSIGEAVGVVAAQSIGEPGTQLTMRTFHTGGVFSGNVSDQIKAAFDGIVVYKTPIAGKLIRTPEGKIAFLTKAEGSFSVYRSLDNQTELEKLDKRNFKIPFYTLLFSRNGEKVQNKQVIAQISSINRQKTITDQAELTIKAEISGLFYSKNLEIEETKIGPILKDYFAKQNTKPLAKQEGLEVDDDPILDTINRAWNWGYAWILSGKIYQLPLTSALFPIFGDFINKKTYMNSINWYIPGTFGSSFQLNMPFKSNVFNSNKLKKLRQNFYDKEDFTLSPRLDFTNSTGLKKRNLFLQQKFQKLYEQKRGFASNPLPLAKQVVDTGVKDNKINKTNNLIENEFNLLKIDLISFELSNIIYQSIGYFLKLSEPSASFSNQIKSFSILQTRPAILSVTDNLFLFSSIGQKNKKLSESNSIQNNLINPSNWKPSFNVFLNWFPKRFFTKTSGVVFFEPISLNFYNKTARLIMFKKKYILGTLFPIFSQSKNKLKPNNKNVNFLTENFLLKQKTAKDSVAIRNRLDSLIIRLFNNKKIIYPIFLKKDFIMDKLSFFSKDKKISSSVLIKTNRTVINMGSKRLYLNKYLIRTNSFFSRAKSLYNDKNIDIKTEDKNSAYTASTLTPASTTSLDFALQNLTSSKELEGGKNTNPLPFNLNESGVKVKEGLEIETLRSIPLEKEVHHTNNNIRSDKYQTNIKLFKEKEGIFKNLTQALFSEQYFKNLLGIPLLIDGPKKKPLGFFWKNSFKFNLPLKKILALFKSSWAFKKKGGLKKREAFSNTPPSTKKNVLFVKQGHLKKNHSFKRIFWVSQPFYKLQEKKNKPIFLNLEKFIWRNKQKNLFFSHPSFLQSKKQVFLRNKNNKNFNFLLRKESNFVSFCKVFASTFTPPGLEESKKPPKSIQNQQNTNLFFSKQDLDQETQFSTMPSLRQINRQGKIKNLPLKENYIQVILPSLSYKTSLKSQTFFLANNYQTLNNLSSLSKKNYTNFLFCQLLFKKGILLKTKKIPTRFFEKEGFYKIKTFNIDLLKNLKNRNKSLNIKSNNSTIKNYLNRNLYKMKKTLNLRAYCKITSLPYFLSKKTKNLLLQSIRNKGTLKKKYQKIKLKKSKAFIFGGFTFAKQSKSNQIGSIPCKAKERSEPTKQKYLIKNQTTKSQFYYPMLGLHKLKKLFNFFIYCLFNKKTKKYTTKNEKMKYFQFSSKYPNSLWFQNIISLLKTKYLKAQFYKNSFKILKLKKTFFTKKKKSNLNNYYFLKNQLLLQKWSLETRQMLAQKNFALSKVPLKKLNKKGQGSKTQKYFFCSEQFDLFFQQDNNRITFTDLFKFIKKQKYKNICSPYLNEQLCWNSCAAKINTNNTSFSFKRINKIENWFKKAIYFKTTILNSIFFNKQSKKIKTTANSNKKTVQKNSKELQLNYNTNQTYNDLNLLLKPSWFYYTEDLSKFFFYNKKFLHPGKNIDSNFVFDRISVYIEIISLTNNNSKGSNVYKTNQLIFKRENWFTKNRLQKGIQVFCSKKSGEFTPHASKIYIRKTILNKDSRFKVELNTKKYSNSWNNKADYYYQEKQESKQNHLSAVCRFSRKPTFIILIRKANEFNFFNDVDSKKEIYQLANQKNCGPVLYNLERSKANSPFFLSMVKKKSVIDSYCLPIFTNNNYFLVQKLSLSKKQKIETKLLQLKTLTNKSNSIGKYVRQFLAYTYYKILSTDLLKKLIFARFSKAKMSAFLLKKSLKQKHLIKKASKPLTPLTPPIGGGLPSALLKVTPLSLRRKGKKQGLKAEVTKKYCEAMFFGQKPLQHKKRGFKIQLSCILNIEANVINTSKKKQNFMNKAYNSIRLYSHYKTGSFNKQKITTQTISKYPPSELKIIPSLFLNSVLTKIKTQSNISGFPRILLENSLESSLILKNSSTWGFPFDKITSLKSMNLNPFILSYKAPYSLSYPFKTPMFFFSEQQQPTFLFKNPFKKLKQKAKLALLKSVVKQSFTPKVFLPSKNKQYSKTFKKILSTYLLKTSEIKKKAVKNNFLFFKTVKPILNFKKAAKKSLFLYGKNTTKKQKVEGLSSLLTSPYLLSLATQGEEKVKKGGLGKKSDLKKKIIAKLSYYKLKPRGGSNTEKSKQSTFEFGKVFSNLSTIFSLPIVDYSLVNDLPNSLPGSIQNKTMRQGLKIRNHSNNKAISQSRKTRSLFQRTFFSSIEKIIIPNKINYLNKVNNKNFLFGMNGPGTFNDHFHQNPFFSEKNEKLFLINQKSLYKAEFISFINNHVNSQFPFIKTYSYSSIEGELIYKKKKFKIINDRSCPDNKKGVSDKIYADLALLKRRKSILSIERIIKENFTNEFLRNKFVDHIENSCMILTKADQISFSFGEHLFLDVSKNKSSKNQNKPFKYTPFKKISSSQNYKNIYLALENFKKRNQYVINESIIDILTFLTNSTENQSPSFGTQESSNVMDFISKLTNNQDTLQITSRVIDGALRSNAPDNAEKKAEPKQSLFIELNKIPAGFAQQKNRLLLGEFLVYGDQIQPNFAVSKGGQIIHLNNNKITLRKGQPIFVSPQAILHKYDGDFIDEQSSVITLAYQQLKTGDIVQGIPKIEQFFEARTTKRGRLFRDSLENLLKALFNRYNSKLSREQAVRQSFYKIQQIIIDGVQRVYRSQGVTITDKHLEVIVKQMTSKVRITFGGSTGYLPGEICDLYDIEFLNKQIRPKIMYEPIVLGITKASLEVKSFLSAASFQQTTRVLTKAALLRKTDYLNGLKENVILGNLIPAGTGYLVYLDQSKDI